MSEHLEAAVDATTAEIDAEIAAGAAETAVLSAEEAIALAEVQAARVIADAEADIADAVEQSDQNKDQISWLKAEMAAIAGTLLAVTEAVSNLEASNRLILDRLAQEVAQETETEEVTAETEARLVDSEPGKPEGQTQKQEEKTLDESPVAQQKRRHRPFL